MTRARPDLLARDVASSTPYPLVVQNLTDLIGARIVAFIGGVRDTRTVENWKKSEVPAIPARRLEIGYACALTLGRRYEADRIKAWFTWLNDFLDDASPAAYLRGAEDNEQIEQRGNRLLQAARRELAE